MKMQAQASQLLSQNHPSAISNASGFPAHPYHHLLIHPDDDNQWLFGIHLDHMEVMLVRTSYLPVRCI
jgi:hypothetical protein